MNIYVGNMSYGISEGDLKEIFAEYGSVEKVNVIIDRETGNSKGFGFVEMSNDADAAKAIKELNNKEIEGRNLKVNQARPKADRPRQNRRSW